LFEVDPGLPYANEFQARKEYGLVAGDPRFRSCPRFIGNELIGIYLYVTKKFMWTPQYQTELNPLEYLG
jgi:hypothetical protein